MNETIKSQLQIGGAIAIAAAGLVGLTNYLLPALPKPQMLGWTWNKNDNDPYTFTEFHSSTNEGKSWQLYSRIWNTNVMFTPNTNKQEWFKMRNGTMYLTGPEDKPVTNFLYSDWSRNNY